MQSISQNIFLKDNFVPYNKLPQPEKLGDREDKEHSFLEKRVLLFVAQNQRCQYVLGLHA